LRIAKERKGIVVVQLDVSKAFNTIPHQAIGPALQKQGIPVETISTITNSCKGLSTNTTYKGSTIKIALRQGICYLHTSLMSS
jgi:hypothetical protein